MFTFKSNCIFVFLPEMKPHVAGLFGPVWAQVALELRLHTALVLEVLVDGRGVLVGSSTARTLVLSQTARTTVHGDEAADIYMTSAHYS